MIPSRLWSVVATGIFAVGLLVSQASLAQTEGRAYRTPRLIIKFHSRLVAICLPTLKRSVASGVISRPNGRDSSPPP